LLPEGGELLSIFFTSCNSPCACPHPAAPSQDCSFGACHSLPISTATLLDCSSQLPQP
jgi:hypothetical protein